MLVPGVAPPQGEDFALPLVELHEAAISPVLWTVEVPLDDSRTLRHISHSSLVCIVYTLAEGALCADDHVINEDLTVLDSVSTSGIHH